MGTGEGHRAIPTSGSTRCDYAAIVRLIGTALGDEAGTAPLTRKLKQLDAEYRHGLAHCARHQIVTSHAAFEYLARRYGLVQVPLEGPHARG